MRKRSATVGVTRAPDGTLSVQNPLLALAKAAVVNSAAASSGGSGSAPGSPRGTRVKLTEPVESPRSSRSGSTSGLSATSASAAAGVTPASSVPAKKRDEYAPLRRRQSNDVVRHESGGANGVPDLSLDDGSESSESSTQNPVSKSSLLITKNSASKKKAWDDESASSSRSASPAVTDSNRRVKSRARSSLLELPGGSESAVDASTSNEALTTARSNALARRRTMSFSSIQPELNIELADRGHMARCGAGRHAVLRRVTSEQFFVTPAASWLVGRRLRRSNSLSALGGVTAPPSWLESKEYSHVRRKNERLAEQKVDPIKYEVVKGRKVIAAASVAQLLDSFAGDGLDVIPDTDFITTFLTCHRYFIDSGELLNKLIDRYDTAGRDGRDAATADTIRLRYLKVIKRWIDTDFIGFRQDKRVMEILRVWMSALETNGGKDAQWAGLLKQSLDTEQRAKQQEEELRKRIQESAPAPRLPINITNRALTVSDLDPLEVARQLTIIDHRMFRQLRSSELYNGCWLKDKKDVTSPTVVQMAARFSKISFWTCTAVITASLDIDTRVDVLSRFVSVCEGLIALNSFNCLMALYCAFNMGPLQRLKNTWKRLPERCLKTLKELDALLDPRNNYKNYRERVRKCTPPLVPFYAVILSDLVSFDEIPNKLSNGHVNMEKMNVLSRVFKDIEAWQQSHYMLHELSWIADFLYTDKLVVKGEDDLYALSKLCTNYEVQLGDTSAGKKKDKDSKNTPRPSSTTGLVAEEKRSRRNSMSS